MPREHDHTFLIIICRLRLAVQLHPALTIQGTHTLQLPESNQYITCFRTNNR